MIDIADKLNNTAFSAIASGLNKLNQTNQYAGMALSSLQAAQYTKQYNNDILNNMESNIYNTMEDVPLEHTLRTSSQSVVPSGIVFGKNTPAYGTTKQSKAYLKTNKLKYRGSRYGKE